MSKDCVVKAGKASSKGAHTEYIAKLLARRMAGRDELAAGAQLDEELISQLTGGGLVDARTVGKGGFDFRPTHLPIVLTNHLPRISGRMNAIRRRLRVLPFDTSFKEAHEYDANDSTQRLYNRQGNFFPFFFPLDAYSDSSSHPTLYNLGLECLSYASRVGSHRQRHDQPWVRSC